MTKREARQLLNERAVDLPNNTINLLRRLVDLVRVPDVQTSDVEESTACPKINNLAVRLRVSERQVTEMISRLRDAGLIPVAPNAGKSRQDVYALNLEPLRSCPLLRDVHKQLKQKRRECNTECVRQYRQRLKTVQVQEFFRVLN